MNTKWRINYFQPWTVSYLLDYAQGQALEGWQLTKVNPLMLTLKRIQPTKVGYCADLLNPICIEQVEKETEWHPIGHLNKELYIFSHDDPYHEPLRSPDDLTQQLFNPQGLHEKLSLGITVTIAIALLFLFLLSPLRWLTPRGADIIIGFWGTALTNTLMAFAVIWFLCMLALGTINFALWLWGYKHAQQIVQDPQWLTGSSLLPALHWMSKLQNFWLMTWGLGIVLIGVWDYFFAWDYFVQTISITLVMLMLFLLFTFTAFFDTNSSGRRKVFFFLLFFGLYLGTQLGGDYFFYKLDALPINNLLTSEKPISHQMPIHHKPILTLADFYPEDQTPIYTQYSENHGPLISDYRYFESNITLPVDTAVTLSRTKHNHYYQLQPYEADGLGHSVAIIRYTLLTEKMTGLYYNYLINRAYLPPERIVEVTSQWQVEQAHLLDGQRLMLRQKNTLCVIDANWSEIEVDLAPIIKLRFNL